MDCIDRKNVSTYKIRQLVTSHRDCAVRFELAWIEWYKINEEFFRGNR